MLPPWRLIWKLCNGDDEYPNRDVVVIICVEQRKWVSNVSMKQQHDELCSILKGEWRSGVIVQCRHTVKSSHFQWWVSDINRAHERASSPGSGYPVRACKLRSIPPLLERLCCYNCELLTWNGSENNPSTLQINARVHHHHRCFITSPIKSSVNCYSSKSSMFKYHAENLGFGGRPTYQGCLLWCSKRQIHMVGQNIVFFFVLYCGTFHRDRNYAIKYHRNTPNLLTLHLDCGSYTFAIGSDFNSFGPRLFYDIVTHENRSVYYSVEIKTKLSMEIVHFFRDLVDGRTLQQLKTCS